jgi:hypothetical protein
VTANATPTVTLPHHITLEDLIGCTLCDTEVTIRDSKCIEGHRVCADCFGSEPFPELKPPF